MNCTFVMCMIPLPRHANCNYRQRVNLLGVSWWGKNEITSAVNVNSPVNSYQIKQQYPLPVGIGFNVNIILKF